METKLRRNSILAKGQDHRGHVQKTGKDRSKIKKTRLKKITYREIKIPKQKPPAAVVTVTKEGILSFLTAIRKEIEGPMAMKTAALITRLDKLPRDVKRFEFYDAANAVCGAGQYLGWLVEYLRSQGTTPADEAAGDTPVDIYTPSIIPIETIDRRAITLVIERRWPHDYWFETELGDAKHKTLADARAAIKLWSQDENERWYKASKERRKETRP